MEKTEAHDLNNDMAIILGLSQLIENKLKGEIAIEIKALVAKLRDRVNRVVENIRAEIQDDAYVTDIIELEKGILEDTYKLNITVYITDDHVFKPVHFNRILINICKNSHEAGSSNLRITMTRNYISFSDDSGSGFSDIFLNKVSKGELYTSKKNGHGVGTKSIMMIADKYGYSVNFTNTPIGGCVTLKRSTSTSGS